MNTMYVVSFYSLHLLDLGIENCIFELDELSGLSWIEDKLPSVSLKRDRVDSSGLSCIIKLISFKICEFYILTISFKILITRCYFF